jgi:hypothetical protein
LAKVSVVYVLAVSFYKPISGTTLRMLLVHVTPLLFAVSYLSAREPFRMTEWRIAGATVTPRHFHLLVTAVLAFDLLFLFRPRLIGALAGY